MNAGRAASLPSAYYAVSIVITARLGLQIVKCREMARECDSNQTSTNAR